MFRVALNTIGFCRCSSCWCWMMRHKPLPVFVSLLTKQWHLIWLAHKSPGVDHPSFCRPAAGRAVCIWCICQCAHSQLTIPAQFCYCSLSIKPQFLQSALFWLYWAPAAIPCAVHYPITPYNIIQLLKYWKTNAYMVPGVFFWGRMLLFSI